MANRNFFNTSYFLERELVQLRGVAIFSGSTVTNRIKGIDAINRIATGKYACTMSNRYPTEVPLQFSQTIFQSGTTNLRFVAESANLRANPPVFIMNLVSGSSITPTIAGFGVVADPPYVFSASLGFDIKNAAT